MNAQMRRIIGFLFACMFVSGFALAPATVTANNMTYYCDPPAEGSNLNLDDCNVAEPNSTPEPGQIVVVIGDMPVGGNAVREPVADHSWMNGFVFGSLPSETVAADELYVAKGDVLGNGRCAVTIFEPGDDVVIYSEGTWQLVRIYNGSADDRMNEARFVAEKAQREVGGAQFCPFVDPSDLENPYADLEAVENGEAEVPMDLSGSSQSNGSVTTEPLGQNVWEGEQLTLPDPVPDGSWLVLKGDADPARGGQCSVMAFASGESPSGYSAGTYDAFLLSGGDDVSYLQAVQAMEEAECPIVRTPSA